jgi:cyclic pyranopterin phosphate synthase
MGLPLLDRFGRIHKYLRLSVTEKCNLACNYCRPNDSGESLGRVDPQWMTPSEISTILSVMVERCGIEKLRLTGGEPTVRRDFQDILRLIPEVGLQKVAITTNAVLLDRFWDDLTEAKVQYINISLDTLDRGKFPFISNRSEKHWDRAWNAIKRAVDLHAQGRIKSVKINTVAMRRFNDDEIESLVVNLTREWPVQLRFIELMPFSGNNFSSKLFVSKNEILGRLKEAFDIQRVVPPEDGDSASVGKDLYQVSSHKGTVGLISSMTDDFCSSCDRLRLTADGKLRNCLFSSTSSEVDLLGPLRGGAGEDELESIIRRSMQAKEAKHGGKGGMHDLLLNASQSRPMISIGG